MSDYICGTCKHYGLYYDFDYHCSLTGELKDDFDTCDDWTDDNEVELTDEEKDAIEGDIECHRRMVEGREIE